MQQESGKYKIKFYSDISNLCISLKYICSQFLQMSPHVKKQRFNFIIPSQVNEDFSEVNLMSGLNDDVNGNIYEKNAVRKFFNDFD